MLPLAHKIAFFIFAVVVGSLGLNGFYGVYRRIRRGRPDTEPHLWSANGPPGVDWTQVYAGLAEPNGRDFICTWSHFDYGKEKMAEDVVYRFDLDPVSGLERTQLLSGKDADAMKLRVCRAGDSLPGLARGQDSPLCQQLVNPHPARKPVTSPPANNRGKSTPGGHH